MTNSYTIPIWNRSHNTLFSMKTEDDWEYTEELLCNGFTKFSQIGSEHFVELSIWKNISRGIFLVDLWNDEHSLFSFICTSHHDLFECYTKMLTMSTEKVKFYKLTEDLDK